MSDKTLDNLSRDGGSLSVEYVERRALVRRHMQAGSLRGDTSPGAVLCWFNTMEIKTPQDSTDASAALQPPADADQQRSDGVKVADLHDKLKAAETRVQELDAE